MVKLKRALKVVPLTALLVSIGLNSAANAAEYVIDKAHTSIGFKIGHLGFSFLTGRFDKFDGSFSFDPKSPKASKVAVKIDTSSVNSNHAERDNHLRSQDFLAAKSFPSASFVSKSVNVTGDKTGTIVGDLTLRGVTKEVTIAATYVGGGKDPWNGFRQGFSGTTKISLADFGITYNLGPSAKEVELVLNVEGIKK